MIFACMGTLGAESPWPEKNETHGFPEPFKNLGKNKGSRAYCCSRLQAAGGWHRPWQGLPSVGNVLRQAKRSGNSCSKLNRTLRHAQWSETRHSASMIPRTAGNHRKRFHRPNLSPCYIYGVCLCTYAYSPYAYNMPGDQPI